MPPCSSTACRRRRPSPRSRAVESAWARCSPARASTAASTRTQTSQPTEQNNTKATPQTARTKSVRQRNSSACAAAPDRRFAQALRRGAELSHLTISRTVDLRHMHICEGRSLELDADSAVAEAVAGWTETPNLVLVFSSPVRLVELVARSLAARFPAAQIVCCTTAGEHLSGAHSNGGLVVTGISSPKLRGATVMIEDLASADEASIRATVGSLFERLAIDSTSFDARRYFCLQFVDGLSGAEERVTPLVADALDGITKIGGTAGDDLAFRRTEVIHGGQARSGAAVLARCECGLDFQLMKHQHFVTTARTLAITKADVAHRRVYELDGAPAARDYARALGVARDQLDAQLTFA